jgi:hypothetical protein
VNGRPTRAWALSIDSETPRCSDQPKESSAVHAKVAVAIAIFPRLNRFMAFLRYDLPLTKNHAPLAAGKALRQIKGLSEDCLLVRQGF